MSGHKSSTPAAEVRTQNRAVLAVTGVRTPSHRTTWEVTQTLGALCAVAAGNRLLSETAAGGRSLCAGESLDQAPDSTHSLARAAAQANGGVLLVRLSAVTRRQQRHVLRPGNGRRPAPNLKPE